MDDIATKWMIIAFIVCAAQWVITALIVCASMGHMPKCVVSWFSIWDQHRCLKEGHVICYGSLYGAVFVFPYITDDLALLLVHQQIALTIVAISVCATSDNPVPERQRRWSPPSRIARNGHSGGML